MAEPDLVASGTARVEWADRAMPVLREIRSRFAAERPLAGKRVAMCMHVTAETANLARTLAAGGATVALAASNPLSTQADTAAALGAAYDVGVFAGDPTDADMATYYKNIHAALDVGPHLVLDDACDLITTLHTERTALIDDVIGGCEQTTTGLVRLRAMHRSGALRIPVVEVGSSGTKQLFDNTYGTGQSVLEAVLHASNLLLAGRTVVVAGCGYCGRGVAARAAGLGASVIVTEIDPLRALDATLNGFTVLPMDDAARRGDVIITVTGNRDVVTTEHLALVRDGAVLANGGHFDVEIDVRALAAAAVEVRRDVRPGADEYVLADGRRVLLLASGRVANLGAGEGHPPDVMDLAFADQALATEWLAGAGGSLEAGVYDVPAEIDAAVARGKLGAMSIGIDTPTDSQIAYLDAWEQGS
ncbi:MAG: adenosylhomocysteinase [Mycobacteriales bacterium]